MGLKYYAYMKDAPISDLLRKANIKTENNFMAFSGSSWKDFPYTDKIIGAYIIFYQDVPIDHGTHVSGPVSQSSTEIDYNAACTAEMDLAHFRTLIHELLDKDLDVVPEEAPLIILDSKSDICMDNIDKYSKKTRHIYRRVNFVRNGEN